ncbi:MAG: hypothetical protein JSV44_05150 [Candidatus Zixiibacteriota bacterium]|nr:MAG: hypothetical protein JSV44_05150 [candidate division Zixibacteria bacterium]
MIEKKLPLPLLSLLVSLATLVVVLYLVIAGGRDRQPADYSVQKNLAGELSDNNLPRAAIEEYRKILSDTKVDTKTRANINYLIGEIYFEDLFDYENAAAYYVRARSLNPDGSFYNEAGRNLIASLERMGRLIDAKRELDKSVNLDSVYAAHEGEKMVAKIGEKPVFLSELEEELQNMPPEIQKQFVSREGKLAALNKYIGWELIMRAAIRESMDADPEMIKARENLEKQLLLEKYITERIMPEGRLDTADVRNFYLVHKDDRYEGQSFDDVRTRVLQDYQQEKFQQLLNEHVTKLMAVDRVQIFEENVQ